MANSNLVFLVKSPRGDLPTKYHKEFEDMTGMTAGGVKGG